MKKVKKLEQELEFFQQKYNEIYYSKTWQTFLVTRKIIKKIKRKLKLIFSPPLRPDDIPLILKKTKLEPGKKVLVNLAVMGWQRKKQRPQHLCEQFAKNGHLVFYVNNHFIVKHEAGLNKAQVAKKMEVKKLTERIYQVSLVAFQDLVINQDQVENLWDKRYIKWSLEALQEAIGIKKKIIKIDNPFWHVFVKNSNNFLIYDCMDNYSAFWQMQTVSKFEPLIAKRADLVLASSDFLYQKMKKINKNSFLVENGVDFPFFSKKPKKIPGEIEKIKYPIIGYYGAISSWFDDKLLMYLARKRPQWQFVLIGNVSSPLKLKSLLGMANIYFLGEKHYRDLPAYLNSFDVCLIPFLKNKLTCAVSPIKLFEYLAAAKPVVSVDLPEVRKCGKLVYLAKNKKDFLEKVETALKEKNFLLKKKRQQFACHNTWTTRYNQIIKFAVNNI